MGYTLCVLQLTNQEHHGQQSVPPSLKTRVQSPEGPLQASSPMPLANVPPQTSEDGLLTTMLSPLTQLLYYQSHLLHHTAPLVRTESQA